jgi:aryl-alcohol dehydrogenase-like predicted oxidoreductase
VDSLQQELSMLKLDDRDLIRWCGEVGTGVVTYGPLGFDLLTGALSRADIEALTDWRVDPSEGPFTDIVPVVRASSLRASDPWRSAEDRVA